MMSRQKPGDLPGCVVSPMPSREGWGRSGKFSDREPRLSIEGRGFFMKSLACRAFLCLLLAGGAGRETADGAPQNQPSGSQDTTRIYPLDEIVTTASRAAALLRIIPSSLSAISRQQIELQPGRLLADAIGGIPGLFLRPYGGGSSLQTLSLRGMTPENTLVLIDGQRVNSYQNGQTDLGFLSSSNIERVEIVRGGYSAVYGADAVGGVVYITTRRPPERLTGSLEQTLGSAGFQSTGVTLGGTSGSLGVVANLRKENGRGDYSYFFDNGLNQTETRRNGNDFQLLEGQVRTEWVVKEEGRAFLSATYSDASRGVGSPVSDLSTVSRARLGDKTLRATAGGEYTLGHGVSTRFAGTFSYNEEEYADPTVLINGAVLKSGGTNRAFQITPELRFAGSPALSGSFGLEYGRAWYEGSDLREANRYQQSLSLTTQHSFDLHTSIPLALNIFPSLRYDHFSDADGDISPRLGINIGVLKDPDIRLRSSYGKSFRVPTFNDLYWIAGGNPKLRPERSLSFDAGLLAGLNLAGGLALDISYFNIRTRDRIVWSPTSGTFWSPANLSEVRSEGVEVEGNWTGLDGLLQVTANSTWNTVTKTSEDFPGDPTRGRHLVYVPKQTFNAMVTVSWESVRLFLQESWTSFRYTTEVNDRFLPSFAVTSAALRYRMPTASFQAFVKLEATNIFNARYQVIALYPMPLRELKVTVGGEL